MRKQNIQIIIASCIIFVVVLIGLIGYNLLKNKNINIDEKLNSKDNYNSIIKNTIDYNNYFNSFIKVKNDKKIYILEKSEFKEFGTVYQDVVLSLEKDEYLNQGYFKIKDTNYYINYKDIEKSEEEVKDLSWKNYIPFNESVKTIDKTDFYLNEKLVMEVNTSLELPIIIKDNDYYGVSYKDNLYYVKKEECEVFENKNTELKHTNGISTLVYHATYDSKNQEEKRKCINNNATICLSDIQFDSQMKYLVDNKFYTASMKDLEMFIDGNVQLPAHTVVITIDDGYFADAAVKILEKYNLHATLFLIGALSEVEEWKTDAWYSKSLELHSHTYNMHTPGACSGGQGSALKCVDKNQLLEDLKKSREQLKGSTVFCYPFFEYNDYAINILKEAGFTMAFAGGRQKIKVGSNKMTLARYGIINTSTLEDFKRVIY